MPYKHFILAIAVLFILGPFCFAQDLTVSDSENNVLMKVNDEGASGSLSLPSLSVPPATPVNKLYNKTGVLTWGDAQLGLGWRRAGTNVTLADMGDKVGVGVSAPDATLHVNGHVKITGGFPGEGKVLTSDADGIAAWQTSPFVSAENGGNLTIVLSATGDTADINHPPHYSEIVKFVDIEVPGPGKILVFASGYAEMKSTGTDRFRAAIMRHDSSSYDVGNSLFIDEYNAHSVIVTDCKATGTSGQYTSWTTQRGFTLSTGGTYRYRLWADNSSDDGFIGSTVSVHNIDMVARYYPE